MRILWRLTVRGGPQRLGLLTSFDATVFLNFSDCKTIELNVIICGAVAGTLVQDERGLMSFSYLDGYEGVPLSLSMPISNRTFGQNVVRPYLFGLLPDDERQRRAISSEYDVRPNNPVALLRHIGLDCPGGVQFCTDQQLDSVLSRDGSYRELTQPTVGFVSTVWATFWCFVCHVMCCCSSTTRMSMNAMH